MEKSTILKLRQQEASFIETNGSFSTTLQQKVLLEEGDVVKLHSAFIDTTTESIISIPDPIEISLTCIKYFDNAVNNTPFAYTASPLPATAGDILGAKYISCYLDTVGGANTVQPLISIKIVPVHHGPGRQYGGGNIYYKYLSPNGSGVYIDGSIYIRPYSTTKDPRGVDIGINVLMGPSVGGKPQYVWNPDGQGLPFNVGGSGTGAATIGPSVAGQKIAIPFERTFTFTLAAGVYSPAEIAQIVTDRCSELNSGGPISGTGANYPNGPYAVNSAFCTTLTELGEAIPVSNTELCFVREGDQAYSTTTPVLLPNPPLPVSLADDILLGTNNFSLNYDPNLKKLNFDLIHTPYQVAVNSVWVPGITYPNVSDQPETSYSGIAFTKLEPESFWQKLGFLEMPINFSYDPDPVVLTDNTKVHVPFVTLTPGTNITQQYLGIDTIWNKAIANPFYKVFIGDVETALTTPVVSTRTFNDVINDEGYYFIDVGIKLPQTLIGGAGTGDLNANSNRVQAIVGKFYTSGNYLQVGSDSAILYQHVGQPQLLNDLTCRILHADMTVPENLEIGPKNSIFLELIKTIQQPQPPTKTQ